MIPFLSTHTIMPGSPDLLVPGDRGLHSAHQIPTAVSWNAGIS